MSSYLAQISHKKAYLNTEFGLQLAMRKFNLTEKEIEAIVGRYSRGKRKGELRGIITWKKVERGGWVRMGAYDHDGRQANGFVCRFKVSFGYEIRHAFEEEKIFRTTLFWNDWRADLQDLVEKIQKKNHKK